MNYDISNCVFPFLGYSEFLRNQKFPLIIEGKNGNGVPNPRFRGSWCLVAEEFAAMLLNSGVIEIPWKKDFEIDSESHGMWDIINSENITIEVKSTTSEAGFRRTSARLNNPKQHQSVILKLFAGEFGFSSAKFVCKLGEKNWIDVTDKLEEFRDY